MTTAAQSPTRGPATSPPRARGMRNVILLVGAAIVLFIGFSAYSIRVNLHSRAELSAISARYFPLLQSLDANIVRLDKLEETYTQVVITGDRDSLGKADEIVASATQALSAIAKLDPGHAADIARLNTDLHSYADQASKTCLAFLDQDRAAAIPQAAAMKKALTQARSNLMAFRQSSYERFLATLAHAQIAATVSLALGILLGLMNLAFMAILVLVIRNNLKMTAVIADQNATLEQRILERTAQLSQRTSDINAMLQNMPLGVATVIPGNRLHPEYSQHLRTIFGMNDLADKDIVEHLFRESNLGVDARDQVKVALAAILDEDPMMFECNAHLLPREITLNAEGGQRKIVNLEWTPILNDADVVGKVLFLAQDVTRLREVEATAAHQREELEVISRLLPMAVDKFHSFVESAQKYLAANRALLESTLLEGGRSLDSEAVGALFRNMHTVKGNARTLEFSHITDVAHVAEQSYDRLRKRSEPLPNPEALLAELAAVEAAVARYIRVNDEILGRKSRATRPLLEDGVFVSKKELVTLRDSIEELSAITPSTTTIFKLREKIEVLGLVALPRLLSASVESLDSLAKELGKPAPAVDITGTDIALDPGFSEALRSCLMHIFRNCLDHGIESPAERMHGRKPERGSIRLNCQRTGDGAELRISDDGRGLALDRLFQKAVSSGLFHSYERPTRAAVAELIFLSGVSTAAKVTNISGRGVGMDAVRRFLREQGASIRVELEDPRGLELAAARFELIISMPLSAVSHAA